MIDVNDYKRFLAETAAAGKMIAAYSQDCFRQIRTMTDDPYILDQIEATEESIQEQIEVIDTFLTTVIEETFLEELGKMDTCHAELDAGLSLITSDDNFLKEIGAELLSAADQRRR